MKKLLTAMMLSLLCISARAQHIKKGYHGFVDVGYCFNTGSSIDPSTFEVSTTHGYQFNPYIFIGAGVGFDFTGSCKWGSIGGKAYLIRDAKVDIPVFFDARVNFTKTRFIPFIDAKIGTTVSAEAGGVFYTAAIGCRCAVATNMGVSISAGWEHRNVQVQEYNYRYIGKYTYEYYTPDDCSLGGPVIRVGFDF